MTDDQRAGASSASSPLPIGPADGPAPIDEAAVAKIQAWLRSKDDDALSQWVTDLTWEHTETAGHWDRVEAGTRELSRRILIAETEN